MSAIVGLPRRQTTLEYLITADNRGLDSVINNTERHIKNMETSLAEAEGNLKNLGGKGQQSLRMLQRAFEKTGKEAEEAFEEIDEMIQDMLRTGNKQEVQLAKRIQQYRRVNQQLKDTRESYEKMDRTGRNLRRHFEGIRNNQAKMMPYLSAFNQGLSAAQGTMTAITASAAALVGFWVQGAIRVRQLNRELAEQRNISLQAGIDRHWMATELLSARIAGAEVDATAIAQFGERVGEAAIDPESEQGRIVRGLLEPQGIDPVEANVEDVIRAIEDIEDASTRFFLYNTIAGGEFAEQMLIARDATDRTREALSEMVAKQIFYEDELRDSAQAVGIAQKSIESVWNSLAIRMSPALEEVSYSFAELAQRFSDFILHSPEVGQAIDQLTDFTLWLIEAASKIPDFFQSDYSRNIQEANKSIATERMKGQRQEDRRRQELQHTINISERVKARDRALFDATGKEMAQNINVFIGQTDAQLQQILPGIECADTTARSAKETADEALHAEADNARKLLKMYETANPEGKRIIGPTMAEGKLVQAEEGVGSRVSGFDQFQAYAGAITGVGGFGGAGPTVDALEKSGMLGGKDKWWNRPVKDVIRETFTIGAHEVSGTGAAYGNNPVPMQNQNIDNSVQNGGNVFADFARSFLEFAGTPVNEVAKVEERSVDVTYNQTITVEGNMDEGTAEYLGNVSRGALADLEDTLP